MAEGQLYNRGNSFAETVLVPKGERQAENAGNDCIIIRSFASKPLETGYSSLEVVWKAELYNSCSTDLSVRTTFKWRDHDDFTVHEDTLRRTVPASRTTTIRGKTWMSATKVRSLNQHGVEVEILN